MPNKYYFDTKTKHIVATREFGDASISCIPIAIFDTRILNKDSYVMPKHIAQERLIPYSQDIDCYNMLKLLYL